MRSRHLAAATLFLASLAVPLRADVKLPAIFGDHMVLQRGMKVPVWGWADPNESVTVTVGDAKATATTDADGKWSTTVDSLSASDKPIDVTIAGKNTVTLTDVLVGDVWVCSGQSNMEFQLGGGSFGFGGALNSAEEIPKADHPTLRLFIVKRKIAATPQKDCIGAWMVSTPQTAPRFSAVGYFFGKEILEDQKVPVGLIGTYWGGTPAESWTSLEGLQSEPSLADLAAKAETLQKNFPELIAKYQKETLPNWQKLHDAWDAKNGAAYRAALEEWNRATAQAKVDHTALPPKPMPAEPEPRHPMAPDGSPYVPSVLTNGMVAPIIPFAIKGVIWYQGEANVHDAKQYETLFPTMITDWRKRWGEGDFPFLWVQLASYQPRNAEF